MLIFECLLTGGEKWVKVNAEEKNSSRKVVKNMFSIKTLKKGFTLIELMVVIAVIAILATIALVGLGGVQKGARDTQRLATVNGIRTALARYQSDKGSYPASNFSLMSSELVNLSYLPSTLNDPGCGAGAGAYNNSVKATGEWAPCGTTLNPVYSYGTAGGLYTIILSKESAGTANFIGPQ